MPVFNQEHITDNTPITLEFMNSLIDGIHEALDNSAANGKLYVAALEYVFDKDTFEELQISLPTNSSSINAKYYYSSKTFNVSDIVQDSSVTLIDFFAIAFAKTSIPTFAGAGVTEKNASAKTFKVNATRPNKADLGVTIIVLGRRE